MRQRETKNDLLAPACVRSSYLITMRRLTSSSLWHSDRFTPDDGGFAPNESTPI